MASSSGGDCPTEATVATDQRVSSAVDCSCQAVAAYQDHHAAKKDYNGGWQATVASSGREHGHSSVVKRQANVATNKCDSVVVECKAAVATDPSSGTAVSIQATMATESTSGAIVAVQAAMATSAPTGSSSVPTKERVAAGCEYGVSVAPKGTVATSVAACSASVAEQAAVATCSSITSAPGAITIGAEAKVASNKCRAIPSPC